MVCFWLIYVYFEAVSVEDQLGLYERNTQYALLFGLGMLLFVTAGCSRYGRFIQLDGTLALPKTGGTKQAISIYKKVPGYMKYQRMEEKPLWWWLRYGTFDMRGVRGLLVFFTLSATCFRCSKLP